MNKHAFHLNTLAILFAGACESSAIAPPTELLASAIEGDGKIAFLDASDGNVVREVDLTRHGDGLHLMYDVHNVQGTSDGAMIWATAMPMGHDGEAEVTGYGDELVGISVADGSIRSRIPLGNGLHAAHVVIDQNLAYVTAYQTDAILEVDLDAQTVVRTLQLPSGTRPHGIRLLHDASRLLVAGMGDGSMHVVDRLSGALASFDLPGRAVQSAVLGDDSAALASIYDTSQIARVDLRDYTLQIFDLPQGSAGPMQIYPAPNERVVWVADQGIVSDHPTGHQIFKVDADTGETLLVVEVDPGPHGIVVDPSGANVYVTTIVEGTIQAFDTQRGTPVFTTEVGPQPNGITRLYPFGAMP
jgi:DNA-binding beta-propeller fold protein YncE